MNNKTVLIPLTVPIICVYLGQSLVVPLLPLYARELGAGGLQIGAVFGSFFLSRAFFLPFIGKWSDIKGRKPFIILGLVLFFLSSIAFLLSHSISALIATRALQGIGASMVIPVAQALVGEISSSGKEGGALSIINGAHMIGLSSGPIIGGILMDTHGISMAFTVMSVIVFLGLIYGIVYLPSESRLEKKKEPKKQPVGFFRLLKDGHVFGISLYRFSQSMCIGTVWIFLPVLSDIQYNISSSVTGILLSVMVLICAVTTMIGGRAADRFNKRGLMLIGGSLCILSLLLLIKVGSISGAVACVVFCGGGLGIALAVNLAMAAIKGKQVKSVGSVMSILLLGDSFGFFIGPILTGLISDFYSIHIGLIVLILFIIISQSISFYLTRKPV